MTKTYELPTGKKVKATLKNKRVAKKFQGRPHFAYTFTIEVGDKVFKTTFHDSIRNYENGIGATKELIDVAMDFVGMDYDSYDYNPNYSDFAAEYGYEDNEALGKSVYKACKCTYESLNEMFTREELNIITEMVDIDLGGK